MGERGYDILKKLLIIILALLLIPVAFVYGATLWSLTVSVEIVSSDGIVVYSDPNLTQIMNDVNFGQAPRGELILREISIANTSNTTKTIRIRTVEDISSFGEIKLFPETPFTLDPGTHSSGWIGLQVYPSALTGLKNFTVEIYE